MTSARNTLEVPREAGWATSTTSTLAGDDHHTLEKNIPDTSSISGKTESDTEAAVKESPEPSEDEYPSGTKLVFIVVALVLAIFLLALDMVRASATPL